MAFFKKLKDRLFKSSSKIDEGLEAIVEDGGVPELPQELSAPDTPAILPDPVRDDIAPESDGPAVTPDVAPEPEPTPVEIADTVIPTPAPIDPTPLADTGQTPAQNNGILGRLLGRKDSVQAVRRTLDDAMLEQLEELLIAADMGVDTALRVTANMAEGRLWQANCQSREIKDLMASEIARIMEPVAKAAAALSPNAAGGVGGGG